jgi:hypothetical protein
MNARYILSVLAVVFLALALRQLSRNGWRIDPKSRAWLLTGTAFGAVSLWLWQAA